MTQLYLACINANGETVKYGKLNQVGDKYFLDAGAEEVYAHVAYLKKIKSGFHDFNIIGETELDTIIDNQQKLKHNVGKLVPITLDEYNEAYDSFPPVNYTSDSRGSSFCFREALTNKIYTFYAVMGGKHYKVNMVGEQNHESIMTKHGYC